MSRYHSYINTAKTIIDLYKGEKPFAIFLKNFFAANKKYGGKDRRQISALCYCYFRVGLAVRHLAIDQQMILAYFLCEQGPSDLMEKLKPEWNEIMTLPLPEKLAVAAPGLDMDNIFPYRDEISDGIDSRLFCTSFLMQPELFIRIRPHKRAAVLKKLEKSALPYRLLEQDCVALTVSDKLEEIFAIDKEIVIQDYNSQKVLDYIRLNSLPSPLAKDKPKPALSTWDCCAASGGKSILLTDIINQKIDLTVSDIRTSIVLNLHQRFKKAGITEYKYFIADISNASFKRENLAFDLIICDAPCSGSGTWSRTPEQLHFFKPAAIDDYNSLQQKIVTNVMPCLVGGGLFIYITCSVFKKENEVIAEWICQQFNCDLLEKKVLKGYDKRADSMFVAVFQKN